MEYNCQNYMCIFPDNTKTWLIPMLFYFQDHIKHCRLQLSIRMYPVEIFLSGHKFSGLLKTAESTSEHFCRKKCGLFASPCNIFLGQIKIGFSIIQRWCNFLLAFAMENNHLIYTYLKYGIPFFEPNE